MKLFRVNLRGMKSSYGGPAYEPEIVNDSH
jgi:hypothetical protein